jgi:hypothetical protein
MPFVFRPTLFLFLLLLGFSYSFAQNTPVPPVSSVPPPPSTTARPDTSKTKGKLKKPVEFKGDSLRFVFGKNGDTGRLRKNVEVKYDEINIKTPLMFFEQNLIRALMVQGDSTRVQFQRGKDNFSTDYITYNTKDESAVLKRLKTQIQDGIVWGKVSKIRSDSVVFVKDAMYTTCDLDEPHWSLRANRMKLVGKKWIFSGPIHLRIFDIPVPAWLPFGAIPTLEGRRAGPLAPSYGSDDRGFYLKDWGWYFPISQYTDLSIRAGIWSLGSWQLAPSFRYAKRYWYNGSLSFDWSHVKRGERNDPDKVTSNIYSLRWSHNQTINPSTNFSANVNLATSQYVRALSDSYNDRVSQTASSRINYSKQWARMGRSMSVAASHDENYNNRQATVSLPSLTYSHQTQYPFRRNNSEGGRERFYETISYSTNFNINYAYRFSPLSTDASSSNWIDGLKSDTIFKQVTGKNPDERFEMVSAFDLPISASIRVNQTPIRRKPINLNISPNVSIHGEGYSRSNIQTLPANSSSIQYSTIADLGAYPRLSAGVSASTEAFGTFNFKKKEGLTSIRHTLRPSMGWSFSPDYRTDFGGAFKDWYFKPLTDGNENVILDKNKNPILYPILNSISTIRQSNLSFSVDNSIQGKYLKTDSTGVQQKNIVQLFNFNIATSYNFAADSSRLAPITLNGRTRLAEKVDFDFSSTWSAYGLYANGATMKDLYLTQSGGGLLRLVSFNTGVSTSFSSKQKGKGRPVGQSPISSSPAANINNFNTLNTFNRAESSRTALGYADFDIPWSLSLDLRYAYNPSPFAKTKADAQSATLNARFDFNLTPKWKVQGYTGYDLVRLEAATTQFSVVRDLHCWEMTFTATPFGRYKSFYFSLYVRSGKLRSILHLDHPKSDVRGRFQGLLN